MAVHQSSATYRFTDTEFHYKLMQYFSRVSPYQPVENRSELEV